MRATLIKVHLWLASFLSAILLMIAVSGGFYLFSEKGSTSVTELSSTDLTLSPGSLKGPNLESDVRALVEKIDPDFEFEYVKKSGNTLFTRPTSRTHFQIDVGEEETKILKHEPDLLKTIVELHKGHGPMLFKRFQQFTAIGLVIVLLTGLWLGLSSRALRQQSLIAIGGGVVVFILLAFL